VVHFGDEYGVYFLQCKVTSTPNDEVEFNFVSKSTSMPVWTGLYSFSLLYCGQTNDNDLAYASDDYIVSWWCSGWALDSRSKGCWFDSRPAGASKGTPGDAKCVTEILRRDKNKEVRGTKFTFLF